jgi:MFS family permease
MHRHRGQRRHGCHGGRREHQRAEELEEGGGHQGFRVRSPGPQIPAMSRLPSTPFPALRHRNFQIFFLGQTTSLVGTWMQSVAQGWLVLQLTNSAYYVGLVSALGSLPVLLVSLPAGVFADRSNKRRVVVATQALALVQALVLAVLIWMHRVELWHVAAAAVFLGLVNAVDIPTRQSLIFDLVGKDDLMNAIALNSSAFNAARIIGPAIGGVLIGGIGIAACFFLNSVSYVAVIAGLLAMRLPAWSPPPLAGDGLTRFREGARFILGDRATRALVLNTALLSIFGFPYLVLMPVFARDVLHVGAAGLGFLMASVGIGAVVAALGVAAFGPRLPKGRLLVWGGPAFGLAIAAFALTPWVPLAVAILVVSGGAMIANNAVTNTLLQTIVPDGLRGRVMGAYTFVFVGMAPLGAYQAGWLAGRVGVQTAVAAGGLVCALASLALWRLVPEVPRLR